MADYTFSNMPSVSIPRTKFHRTFSHNLSANLGELVVLGIDEVIPGSTHKLEFGSLIRMSSPIAPLMDDIQMDVFSFFCPMRLTWNNWKRFMGENTTGAGAINGVNSDKVIPYLTTKGSQKNSLSDDMGIFPYVSGNPNTVDVSILPFRAACLIYNRWFRNQNVEAPLTVNLGDTATGDDAASYASLYDSNDVLYTGGRGSHGRFGAYKLPDYFISSLPYAIKGDPVSIFPTGAMAPVITGSQHLDATSAETLKMKLTGSNSTFSGNLYAKSGVIHASSDLSTETAATPVPSNLWANLSASVNATIDNLRFAFQLNKFLYKDAMYGSRYWEILYAHYAVTSPDATLQDPQLLGHIKFDINIQQVLQTTGFTDPTNTTLGTPGANSTTGKKGDIFTASFVEHGYIITFAVCRQKSRSYSQGLNRMWSRKSRTDFYFPVFANLGAQKVLNKEIYAYSANPDGIFGYQEAWAEYRYLPSYNSGELNPARTGSLDYWTLGEKFSSTPTLGMSFLKEDRVNLARALTTGFSGPDFIQSWYFKDTVVNPMPLYSIPGFADHH